MELRNPVAIRLCGAFLLLMTSNYLLQSVRDAQLLIVGKGLSSKLFTASTFVSLGFAPLVKMVVRETVEETLFEIRKFYSAFVVILFCGIIISPERSGDMEGEIGGWSFQIAFCSVFFVVSQSLNNVVISLMWSFATDLVPKSDAVSYFSMFGAASTVGQAAGAVLTSLFLAMGFKVNQLVVFIAAAIEGSSWLVQSACDRAVPELKGSQTGEKNSKEASQNQKESSILRILWDPLSFQFCIYTVCYTATMSMIYLSRTGAVEDQGFTIDQAASISAGLSFVSAGFTLAFQAYISSGSPSSSFLSSNVFGLYSLPIITLGGFCAVLLAPSELSFQVVIVFELVRRIVAFAVAKPVREAMLNVLDREDRFVLKSLIDTFLYRGGMGAGAMLFEMARTAEDPIFALSILYLVTSGVWLWSSMRAFSSWSSRRSMENKTL